MAQLRPPTVKRKYENFHKKVNIMPKLSSTVIALVGGVAVSGAAYLVHQHLKKRNVLHSAQLTDAADSTAKNKVLFLGLNGSGKSSILAALSGQAPEKDLTPTEGFNVMCIQTTETPLNVWEIGGTKNMRDYWKHFLNDISVLVYVIDGADLNRFGEAVAALGTLLTSDSVKKNPVYIVINKSDLCSTHVCKSMYDRILDELPELRSPATVSYTITQVPPHGKPQGIDDLNKNLQTMVANQNVIL